MDAALEKPSSEKFSSSIMRWLLIWAGYVILCELAKVYDTTHIFSGGLLLLGTAGTDLLMIFCAYWLWLHTTTTKHIFGLFTISFLCLLGTDLVYHISFSILSIPENETPTVLIIAYSTFYIGYLLAQLGAWLSILCTLKVNERRQLVLYIPTLILILLAYLIYIFFTHWDPAKFNLNGFYNGIDEIFELLSFAPAIICLTLTKNRSITYLVLGYTIIMVSGFFVNFDLISEILISRSIVDSGWTLGAIFMIYGLYCFKRNYSCSSENQLVELPLTFRSKFSLW